MKNFFTSLFILFIILILSAFFLYRYLHSPSQVEATVWFEKGSHLREMSQKLEEAHVIKNALFFESLVRFHKKEKALKWGEYYFPKGILPQEVLNKLSEGIVKIYPITFPEGYNLSEIGKLLIKKKLTTSKEWKRLTSESKWIEKLNIPTGSLEGYLFPSTYYLTKITTAEDVIDMMVEQLLKHLTPERLEKAKSFGLSRHEWVTFASLVEKESMKSDENALIASVFHNRLKIGMLLQTDPTVIYGAKKYNKNYRGNIKKSHLRADHPYNTYIHQGLPPGPIASPGLGALLSVIEPADTGYFYFVAKGDGTHYFSKNYKKHQQAVRFYQLKKGRPPY